MERHSQTRDSFAQVDWANIVVAGGSIVAALHDANMRRGFRNADIDVFVVGLNPAACVPRTWQLVLELEAALQRQGVSKYVILRTANTVTLCFPDPPLVLVPNQPFHYPFRTIQIVCRAFPSVAALLSGFNVDCCCVAYDGASVLAHPRAVRAFKTGINLVNLGLMNAMRASRHVKYGPRGWAIGGQTYKGRFAWANMTCLQGLLQFNPALGCMEFIKEEVRKLKNVMKHENGLKLLIWTEVFWGGFGDRAGVAR